MSFNDFSKIQNSQSKIKKTEKEGEPGKTVDATEQSKDASEEVATNAGDSISNQ